MIRALFDSLQACPSTKALDLWCLPAESGRAFDRLIDFLRSPETFPDGAINALTTLCWRLIGNYEIPLLLDPLVDTLRFLLVRKTLGDMTAFVLPYRYLDLVRTSPIMQLCALTYIASQGCDYYMHRFDLEQTPARAQAYEAHLLLALQPLVVAYQLSWDLNDYLRDVFQVYPNGLASLPAGWRYDLPVYPTERK